MRQNTKASYGSVARSLHWLTALIILSNIALGLWANASSWSRWALKVQVFSFHKTLGLAALVVALVRIGWALTQTRPAPVHPERRLETLLAEAVHWTLYGSMVLVPVTGWIEHAATDGFAPILWPLGQGLPLVPKSPALAMVMAQVQPRLCLPADRVGGPACAGAIKHAVIEPRRVLGRMTRACPRAGASPPATRCRRWSRWRSSGRGRPMRWPPRRATRPRWRRWNRRRPNGRSPTVNSALPCARWDRP